MIRRGNRRRRRRHLQRPERSSFWLDYQRHCELEAERQRRMDAVWEAKFRAMTDIAKEILSEIGAGASQGPVDPEIDEKDRAK